MQTQIKSQIQKEENIPIKNSEQKYIEPQNQGIEMNQQDRFQASSIPVYEKTRLPKDSNIYMNKDRMPQFQEVAINWPFQQKSIVAQQIYSEVKQNVPQQADQQFVPQASQYQPGSGKITHQNIPQIPKMRHSQYLQCKWCNQEVHSQVEFRIGLAQMILCIIFSPAFLCGLIFICFDNCKDCYHFCTNCSCEMGIVRLI